MSPEQETGSVPQDPSPSHPDLRERIRHGMRPALYTSLVIAGLTFIAMDLYPGESALDTLVTFLTMPAGAFAGVLALYASGGVRAPEKGERSARLWIWGVMLVSVVLFFIASALGW